MISQRTFVLLKPDAIERSLVGKILSRFEETGLKIVAMKMVWADEEFASKHYTDDITKRRGEKVRNNLLKYIAEGPVIAFVLEGIGAIENVRKMVGPTEPSKAAPGTIRGDFGHFNFANADKRDIAIKNIIHASGDEKDAEHEIKLWFNEKEMHTYKTVQDFFL